MRVLIVSPYRTVAPHFEHELEIAQRHLDDGDQVSFLSCLGELANCEFNTSGDANKCCDCRLRRAHGLGMLEGPVHQSDFSKPGSTQANALPTGLPAGSFISVERLKNIKVANFDVGNATLSSLISQTKDPEVNLAEHQELLKRFSDSALQVYRAMLERLNPDRSDRPNVVYVFNGRFAAMRAVLRACQFADVECRLHERGCDTNHYQLFRNQLPHLLEVYQARMREHWNQAATVADRDAIGANWFHSRVLGVEKTWHSFIKRQQKGRLPQGWNPLNHNIVVFTSSEDETVAIGDSWSDRIYKDQASAISALAIRLMKSRSDAMITVRIHPNLAGVDNASCQRMRSLDLPNVRVIQAEDAIDSYHLMRVADTVGSFGSTIGIESVFWSKPSVLLAPSFYRDLAGPYRASDHEHAVALLTEDLMPAVRHEALLYGYWQNTHGYPFRYFEPDGLFSGKFKGQVIYAKPPKTFGSRLQKQWRSITKRVRPGNSDRKAA